MHVCLPNMSNEIRNNMNNLFLKTTSYQVGLKWCTKIWHEIKIEYLRGMHLWYVYTPQSIFAQNYVPHPRLTTHPSVTSTKRYTKGSPSQRREKATLVSQVIIKSYLLWLEPHGRSICGVRSTVGTAGGTGAAGSGCRRPPPQGVSGIMLETAEEINISTASLQWREWFSTKCHN
jgi:hypothetical protein